VGQSAKHENARLRVRVSGRRLREMLDDRVYNAVITEPTAPRLGIPARGSPRAPARAGAKQCRRRT
jgi:hypothetical protein